MSYWKPRTCEGCPLFEKSKVGFYADDVPAEAKLVNCMDAPVLKSPSNINAGESTEARRYWDRYHQHTGLDENEVGFMYLFRCKEGNAAKGKDAKVAKEFCRQYDRLTNDMVMAAVGPKAWQYWSKNAGSRSEWRSYFVERDISGAERVSSEGDADVESGE